MLSLEICQTGPDVKLRYPALGLMNGNVGVTETTDGTQKQEREHEGEQSERLVDVEKEGRLGSFHAESAESSLKALPHTRSPQRPAVVRGRSNPR